MLCPAEEEGTMVAAVLLAGSNCDVDSQWLALHTGHAKLKFAAL
jgi:hypothetical protein